MTKRVFLTGAGGFIGSHLTEHLLVNTDWELVLTDSFRHRGKTDRLREILAGHPDWRARCDIILHDLAAPISTQMARRAGMFDYVIAMASESHVDRSISDPVPFVTNNVAVMLNTLEFARTNLVKGRKSKILVISTDEVYGPVEERSPGHREWAPIIPSNPYSASKAAQEAIAISYWRTYTMPVLITNTMNNFAERQDVEKFIPMVIRSVTQGDLVEIHGTRGNVGTRHYLHARNSADAWLFLLRDGPDVVQYPAAERPPRYNVAGPEPVSNLEMAERIAAAAGGTLRYKLVDFHSARPGHDPHYGLDPSKLARLGWKPPVDFGESLDRTVKWTLAHPEWLEQEITMPRVQMLEAMGGFRPGGEPWPPAGAPLDVEDWEAKSLIQGQLARPWPGDAPAPAAVEETAAPQVVTPEPGQVRFDANLQQWVPVPEETAPEPDVSAQPEVPKPAAPKSDWVNWAIRQGATTDEANAATKAELMENYGDRS